MGGPLLLAIAGLILKYGVPATIQIIKTWSQDLKPEDITLEKIEELRIKPPEEYFE